MRASLSAGVFRIATVSDVRTNVFEALSTAGRLGITLRLSGISPAGDVH